MASFLTSPVGTIEIKNGGKWVQSSLQDENDDDVYDPASELAGYFQSSLTGLKDC